jgi:putative exosortase-associated protein (TIGR04073 family)
MPNKLLFLAAVLITSAFLSGCTHVTNTEQKFGRGFANTTDLVRLGEFRRTFEQTALNKGPDVAYTTGFFRGINRTLGRAGIGIYEMVTAPFPPYDPVMTDYFSPGVVYPDSYKPNLISDPLVGTDANLGFSGGDVLPIIPGSRFRIFDTH